MERNKVFEDLYQFNTYMDVIDLSFNQYLLVGEEPLLIHTGSKDQTVELLPKLRSALDTRPLSYIFVSHFESDECGGLSLLKEYFPHAKTICSQVTARQLSGFGITNDIVIKNPGDVLETKDYKLRFIAYPSEMHLWEGLMAFEENRGILFSSDLFIRRGKVENVIVDSDFEKELKNLPPEQIPSPLHHGILVTTLSSLPVKYIASGHGPCLKV